MGRSNQLMGHGPPSFDSLIDAVLELKHTSEIFVSAIVDRRDFARAASVSLTAFRCFDHISTELLRIRDSKRHQSEYETTDLKRLFDTTVAIEEMASRQDQEALSLRPGEGYLPGVSKHKPISYEKTLNKVKHRHPTKMNFRIEGYRHIFLVCPNQPDSIVEFDVGTFCDLSMEAARTI